MRIAGHGRKNRTRHVKRIKNRICELRIPVPSVIGLFTMPACGGDAVLVCDAERLTIFYVDENPMLPPMIERMPLDGTIKAYLTSLPGY
jgi:hypothetical protein